MKSHFDTQSYLPQVVHPKRNIHRRRSRGWKRRRKDPPPFPPLLQRSFEGEWILKRDNGAPTWASLRQTEMRLIYKHKANNTQSTGCQPFTTLPSFKNKLKTFLFSEYFNCGNTVLSPNTRNSLLAWCVCVWARMHVYVCVCGCACMFMCVCVGACACHCVCPCMCVHACALYTFTKLSLALEQVHITCQLWLVQCKLMTIYILMYMLSVLLYCSTPWARGIVHIKFSTWSWRLSYQLFKTNKGNALYNYFHLMYENNGQCCFLFQILQSRRRQFFQEFWPSTWINAQTG